MSRTQHSYKWLEELCRQAAERTNIREALAITAQGLVAHYPGTKIWFAEKLGKRWSYLSGAGKETFQPAEMIRITPRYGVFLQNPDILAEEEKKTLIAYLKQLVLNFIEKKCELTGEDRRDIEQ